MPELIPGLGQRITEIRERRGLLQRELAEKADLSVSYLSEIENGKRTIGSDGLLKLADALNASLEYLVRGASPPPLRETVKIPPNLAVAAEVNHWAYSETVALIEAQSIVVARRTPSSQVEKKLEDWSPEDWINFHRKLFGHD